MLEIISFVFSISASMVSSSRWETDSNSGDNGCWEKIIDLWIKMSNSLPWP